MKYHPTTHWATVAILVMAVAALSFCLEPAMAQTDDPEVHGSYGSTVERRIAQHDSWESAPQTWTVAQAQTPTTKEWTPSDAFGSTSDKPTTDSGDWTPEKEFGNRALSPAEKELAGSEARSDEGVVFHGGYVYPPGTDTSKLKTPQKPTQSATKTPAPKPEPKVARSTPTSTPTTPRHPERSEGSRSTRTASFPASDDTIPTTTEPKAAPSPPTSAEPVELSPTKEVIDEVEFDDGTDEPTGWLTLATAMNWIAFGLFGVIGLGLALWAFTKQRVWKTIAGYAILGAIVCLSAWYLITHFAGSTLGGA